MTIKEFSELLDVSTDTVTRAAKSLFPNRFSQGKAAVFTVAESKQIITAIKHKGILSQNAELLSQNAEVAKAVDAQSIVALLRTAADEIDKRDKQIAVLTPKAEIYDEIADAGNAKTVAQVAQSLGRRWIGCEINPEYHSMQKRRAAQTGLTLHEPAA